MQMASTALLSCLQKLGESQAVEDCTELLEQLTEFAPGSSLEQIIESLTNIWERHVDLDASNCQWRVGIFKAMTRQVSYSRLCAAVFSSHIILASKMFKWCCETFSCLIDERPDCQLEAVAFEIQKVLPEAFLLANAIYANLEECSFLTEETFIGEVGIYMCQSLNFLKISCLHHEKIEPHEDFPRAAQELLSTALKVLLKFRGNIVSAQEETNFQLLESASSAHANIVCHGVNILMDLGRFAAAHGKSWVGMLNIAWKGVTALLQTTTGKETMASIINISDIIISTISCAIESLRIAAETWRSVTEKRTVETKAGDLKRLCIPCKFFLINAIRISSNYPCQAVFAFRDIATCALKITALRSVLSKDGLLKLAAEAIVEIVEPSLFVLLHNLVNTSDLELECRLQFLEQLIGNNDIIEYTSMHEDAWDTSGDKGIQDSIFAGQGEALKLGRLAIFLNLLQSSHDCGKDISFEMAKRLDLSMKMISDATIYAEVFQSHVSGTYNLDSCKATWQCLYISILKSLETFIISNAGSRAWVEAEEFLFRNALHPHVLCRELILELWCFIARHSDVHLIEDHISSLFTILSDISNSPKATVLDWPVRALARLICSIIRAAPGSSVIQLYQLAFGKNPFASTSATVVSAALLREHFPTINLPGGLKKSLMLVIKHVLSEIRSQATENFKNITKHIPTLLLVQEEIICCFLELITQETSEQDAQEEEIPKLIKSAVTFVQVFTFQANRTQQAYFASITLQSLKVISRLWQKMQSDEIKDVVVALHDLFKNGLVDDCLKEIKPVLAETLAGLSEVSIPEDDTDPVSHALWELYHIVLRERHWALAHLALASFGYFAAHTSCNELWRFVPPDAVLAYDARTGTQTNEDSFMSSLRYFLEREATHTISMISKENLKILQHEGELQEKALHSILYAQDDTEPQDTVDQGHIDVDSDLHVDFADSHLPQEIDQAMKMLQDGLSLLKERLPLWLKESGHNVEQKHQIIDQLSLLADVVAQLEVIQTT